MIYRCIFVLFPNTQFQRNQAGIMAPVFTLNITTLDHHSIPQKTTELLENTLHGLENGTYNQTIDDTIICIVNERPAWKVHHQNGRWQSTDLSYLWHEE